MAIADTSREVTLRLSNEEADALMSVLATVGGSMYGPRRHAAATSDALRDALGYDYRKARENLHCSMDGSVFFCAFPEGHADEDE